MPTICSINCIIWNCRGAGKPSAHAFCTRMMVKHRVSFVVLLETQLSGRGLNKALSKLPRDMARYAIPAMGRSGGIIDFWRGMNMKVDIVPVGRQSLVAVINEGLNCNGSLLESAEHEPFTKKRAVANSRKLGGIWATCVFYRRFQRPY